jgi:di/tricarboxylate transporter
VFIISAALTETGLTERIGAGIARAAGSSEWRAILVVMPAVAALAAFSHHLMVTAMMLPIVMRLARVQNLSPSRLLMPMSLAASLGTTLTLFSAPAFLLMNHLLQTGGQETLGVLGITPIGIALVLLAIVYMSLGRWLLPKRKARADEAEYMRPRQLLHRARRRAEVALDRAADDGFQPVLRWPRRGRRVAPDGVRSTTRTAARCSRRATCCSSAPPRMRSSRSKANRASPLHAVKKYGESSEREFDEAPQLVQVIVAPHSPFIGETIAAVDFLKSFNVVVVGMWRRQAWTRDRLSQIQLREGDLPGAARTPDRFAELASHHGVLMMVPFSGQPRRRQHAVRADLIIDRHRVGGRFGRRSRAIGLPGGAVALILTGCVSADRAYREIDVRIYVMIAGVIPLGTGMEKTGTAAFLAAAAAAHDGRLEPARRDDRALLGRGARHADSLGRRDDRLAGADFAGSRGRTRPAAATLHRLHGARRRDGLPDAHRATTATC